VALKDDLEAQVNEFFSTKWTRRSGQVVPDDTSIKLNNDGVDLDAAVLYADLRASTAMVDGYKDWFAAGVYKAYLYCAARVITSMGGAVTAYDGDRIMAVFIGNLKCTNAAKSALKINWIVTNIVQSEIKKRYPKSTFVLKHTVGVDKSKLLVAKTGARGANDLVWVGRAANHAAKLTSLNTYKAYITGEVYDAMTDDAKLGGNPKQSMWSQRSWTNMNNRRIYGSSWEWSV
jgi:class 3 adenylate cyclase